VAFLGYVDSGMDGTPENELDGSFWTTPVDDAAERLAEVLREEAADVLTVYDDNGGYGHPDHIQVHRVGVRAAALAGTPVVLEATMNRDHMRRMIKQGVEAGIIPADEVPDVGEGSTFGQPEAVITTCIDVHDQIGAKRASMAAHASQIAESSFFLQMPEEAFAGSFGWEWFIRRGAVPTGEMDDDILLGVD
jgi:LmbE family N-acetylglucosaminyl deacetylase